MEGYYSSDEDIAVGPVTLNEIRRDLLHGNSDLLNRRQTFGSFRSVLTEASTSKKLPKKEDLLYYQEKMQKSDCQVENNATGTSTFHSEYFTPNETENEMSKIENLKKYDTTQSTTQSTYETASNTLNTTMDIATNKCSTHLFNDSIIVLSDDEEEDSINQNLEEIIEILEEDILKDEINEQEEKRNAYLYKKVTPKQTMDEDVLLASNYEENSLRNLTLNASIENQQDEEDDEEYEDVESENLTQETEEDDFKAIDGLVIENESSKDEKYEEEEYSSELTSEYEKKGNDFDNSLNLKHDSLLEDEKETFNSNSKCNEFNDTLQEMEFFLNDTSYNENKEELTSAQTSNLLLKESNLPLKENNLSLKESNLLLKENNLPLKEVNIPQKQQVVNEFKFKTPRTTPKATTSKGTNFKDVISPIGFYIKNSPSIPLKRNIPIKKCSFPLQPSNSDAKSKKENVACEIPEVVYKPAKKTLVTNKFGYNNLPGKIQKLVPQSIPNIIKHKGRTNIPKPTSVHTKLSNLQSNLTLNVVDESFLNNTQDCSLLSVQKAYIP